MREILFRGKRTDGRGWAYGYLVRTPITTEFNCDGQFLDSGEGRLCIVQDGVAHEVDSETVGQYIGLTDKRKKKIFDGSTVRIRISEDDMPIVGKVIYNEEQAGFNIERPKGYRGYSGINRLTIDTAFEFDVIDE